MPEQRPVAQRVLAHALDTLLRLLHPMIPFLTEEVWQLLGEVAPRADLPQPKQAPLARRLRVFASPSGLSLTSRG